MNLKVQCQICPKQCEIGDGQSGDCRIRINRGGKLLASTYGRPCSLQVDPIEKKPFFHFLPTSRAFSLATAGCNLHCNNCQNWQISQAGPLDVESEMVSPETVVALALRSQSRSIAYTYSDPVVFYEYTRNTAQLAREKGIRNALVTAAYISPGPLRELCKVTDAATVDLKFMDDALYRSNCDATLKPVLDALVIFKEEGVWLEVSNLVIPTLNDDSLSIERLCEWVVKNLGPDVPLHFLRFHPLFRLRHLPPTPEETLNRARKIAMDRGVRHCYVGNVWGNEGEHTRCPKDGKMLIRRAGYQVQENNLTEEGCCPECGEKIAGVWK